MENERETILAVDDEPVLLAVLSELLEAADYRVRTAACGREALEILERETIDLIVADIAMPGMNGYQLFKQVTEHAVWTRVPFIFLTARDLDSDIRFGVELGVDDYLIKPVKQADLLATVRGKLRAAARREQALQSDTGQPHQTGATGQFKIGPLEIDPMRHRVWLDEEEIRFSAREFLLLEHLARHRDTPVPVGDLVEVTHQLEVTDAEASGLIRPMVRSVRRKLGYAAGELGCIENVRGVGYRLIAPV